MDPISFIYTLNDTIKSYNSLNTSTTATTESEIAAESEVSEIHQASSSFSSLPSIASASSIILANYTNSIIRNQSSASISPFVEYSSTTSAFFSSTELTNENENVTHKVITVQTIIVSIILLAVILGTIIGEYRDNYFI